MKREFASLTPPEALHVAIFIEERNAAIYHQFAELFAEFHDPESLEIAATFWDMASEERQHGTLLQKRYFDYHSDLPPLIAAKMLGGTIVWEQQRGGQWVAVVEMNRAVNARVEALPGAANALP